MDYLALVKTIALSLVTKPEAVEVTSSTEEGVQRLLLRGKGGRLADAQVLQAQVQRVQIVRVSSAKAGDSVEVDVAENAAE